MPPIQVMTWSIQNIYAKKLNGISNSIVINEANKSMLVAYEA